MKHISAEAKLRKNYSDKKKIEKNTEGNSYEK